MPSTSIIIFSALVVFLAGMVRGFSGFGFSMIVVTGVSLVMPPVMVVPCVLLMEVMASVWLLPGIYREIDWKRLIWLWVGVAIGIPAGVYILAHVPDRHMRAAIGIVVVLLAGLLYRGFRLKNMPGSKAATATGLVSGVLNGGAAVGGPPIILFYLSSPAGAAVSRATMIAFFIGTDVWASAVCAVHGLITYQTLVLFLCWLVPLLAGVMVGAKSFSGTNEEAFRRKVLVVLVLLGIAGLVRAIIG